jgi:hypothetical protein
MKLLEVHTKFYEKNFYKMLLLAYKVLEAAATKSDNKKLKTISRLPRTVSVVQR